jgi:hypothetical protein
MELLPSSNNSSPFLSIASHLVSKKVYISHVGFKGFPQCGPKGLSTLNLAAQAQKIQTSVLHISYKMTSAND